MSPALSALLLLACAPGRDRERVSPKPPLLSPVKVIPNPPRLPPRSQAESRAACRAPACQALSPASPPASPCCNQRKKRLSVPAHPPSARELPAAVGASLPSWGAGLPQPAAPGAFRAVLLPQQGAHPQLLQGPGAAEREEKQRQAPLPPRPWAEAGACTALPRGEGHRGRTKPRGAGQRRCQSPGSLSSSFWPSLLGTCTGCRNAPHPSRSSCRHAHRSGPTRPTRPASLPAGVLPAPCPGSARRPPAVPSTPWPCSATSLAQGTRPHGPATWHRDSPESGEAGARGPHEEEGGPVLLAAFLLLLGLFFLRRLLPVGQHPQLVQGQAELWAQAVAPSAEKRGRQGAGGGLLGVPAGRALSPACRWEGGWCMEQQGGGAWGWRQGVPVLVPGPGLGERQLGCEGLTATWRRPVPPGGGEGASRSSCGPGSAARPRSAPARRR